MSEQRSRQATRLLPLSAVVILAALAGIYWLQARDGKLDAQSAAPASGVATSDLKSLASGSLAAFVVKPERKPVADIRFQDETGKTVSLGDWKGRVVLVNLWATWCAPCRKEMPSLAELQKALGSDDFEVVAISVDRKGAEASSAFLKETGADNLKLYVDPSTETLNQLQALGLPATFLIDRNGHEIGRLLGPAEWNSPEAKALIEAALKEPRA
jgi:thiol-disulfide isomerase/thioredoxin